MQPMLHETNDTPPIEELTQTTIQERRWLLLIYRVPTEPSSARTAIWRETRRLGALSLQHAVCLLPLSETSRAANVQTEERVSHGR